MKPEYLISEESLDQFLADFETAAIPFSDWTHSAHIAMACCYIQKLPLAELLPGVRERIKSYNVRGGGQNTDSSGYHETLTVLWLWVLKEFVEEQAEQKNRLQMVLAAIEKYGGNRLYPEFYSYEVAKSVDARRRWVEPDRKLLPDEFCPFEE